MKNKSFSKHKKRLSSILLTVILCIANFPVFGVAAETDDGIKYPDEAITVSLDDVTADNGFSRNGDKLEFASKEGTLSFTVDVPKTADYYIGIKYSSAGDTNDVYAKVKIDGKVPFEDVERFHLPRFWSDSEELTADGAGNQFSPEQLDYTDYVMVNLYDVSGTRNLPYTFALEEGKRTVSLEFTGGKIVIDEISLNVPDMLTEYSEVENEYIKSGYKALSGEALVYEAEKALYKNSRSVIPKSDASVDVSPSDAFKQVINYIGGTNWKTPGEEITWKINVPESGLYTFHANYKQDENINANSYRVLKIDGKIPFAEASTIGFYYTYSWKQFDFADEDGELYKIYLTEGEHIISLSATLGETSDNYEVLKNITEKLGDLYLDIAMITSDSPDSNRDYELFKQIPDFEKRLSELYSNLTELSNIMKAESDGETTSLISAVNNMARVVDSMRNNLYTAQDYLKDYYNNYTSLSAWLTDMKSMPLSLDRIYFAPAEETPEIENAGFFASVIFSIKRFCASFIADYNGTASGSGEDSALKIWVNWGRDQAMVLNALIEESFTPQTGISVNLELTDATLVKGIISNTAPDLALHMTRTEPVNLAMRGALYDLTKFSDFEEVKDRFAATATEPYMYGDGIYALPDTQNFYLMFYRSDILEALGLEVPKTWDEFLKATAVLQRNNMQSWIPYTQITSSTTVNTGVGGLNLFPSILQQYGYEIYNEQYDGCTLDSAEALKAFTYWTDMYTKYKLPTTASFYNRFKVGTMPLGVEVYTMYTQLKETAPEIEGRWGIALVPGTEKEDGTVDHSISGSGTGCAILNSCDNPNDAWEFLKWWTGEETQLRYSNNVESILGSISRVTTSNLSAFEKMSWDYDALEILKEQRSMIKEVREVPGSYYVSRAIDQAFWKVVNGDDLPKDALLEWNDIANNEIERKIKQYGK